MAKKRHNSTGSRRDHLENYISEVGDILNYNYPENITFVTRISNSRFLIFLSSKELVHEFITKHHGITVREKFIPARKFINQLKKSSKFSLLF